MNIKYFCYLSLLIFGLLSSCSGDFDDGARGSFDPSLDVNSSAGEFLGNTATGVIINTEQYNGIVENPFIKTTDESISTFSIDADGAAYSNVRRFLTDGQEPPVDAIRTEELVNYFNYNYQEPFGLAPISLEGEISTCPWQEEHKLLRIGIKGKDLDRRNFPASNLVILVDVSGSMSADNKIGLLKQGLQLLVDQFTPEDRIAIVTYASQPGTALESTSGADVAIIKGAIENLSTGGGTNGAGGILEAYKIAEQNFIEGGNNRILLATDGDFNVGVSSQDELVDLIEGERDKGIFLTVVGLGTGNYQEGRMEQLANNGNGTFEYIDNLEQAEKVFVNEYNKFFAVAKDVKVQIAFNSDNVKEYRLIGYENRLLNTEDFEDDTKDAGEISAGQSITALYQLVLNSNVDRNEKFIEIDFRYKEPDADVSQELSLNVFDENKTFVNSTSNQQFAASVASFGLYLRDSEHKGETNLDLIESWATRSMQYDPYGYKNGFLDLIEKAR